MFSCYKMLLKNSESGRIEWPFSRCQLVKLGCYCKCFKSMQNGVISIRSSLYTDVLSEYSRKRGRLSGPFPIVNC